MSSIEVIENKISTTIKYLKILSRYQNYSLGAIKKNLDLRGAIERYLYLVVQSTIDLAEAVIAYKDLRKPTTMAESFYILHEEGIMQNEKLLEKLVNMVGFRNIIAHDYGEIDYDIVYDILQKRTKDILDFLKIVKKRI